MREWFSSQNFTLIDIETETSRFADYWKGQGKPMADWEATWRNGMRNAEKWAAEKSGPKAPAAPASKKWKDIDFENLVHEE